MSGERVLVTGGSGFVGSYCILKLLEAGYQVRTTVRSLKREPDVRAMLREGGAEPGDRLEFAAADLMSDAGWSDAVKGCEYVLHVASPFPAAAPKDENELIIPAREGTLRVLRAARDAGVRRVVLTSSFAAVGYGHADSEAAFTEADWTNVNENVGAYVKSKTLAERAAWDFIAREGGKLELAVVNPVGITGPVLGKDLSTSIDLVKMLMDGALPGLPRLSFGLVDVRDVADLHVMAMTHPAAKGERFLAVAGEPVWIADVARIMKTRLGDAARRVPTRQLPDWLMRVLSVFVPAVRANVGSLGKFRRMSNAKARQVLGWQPRSNEDTILATAESLVRLGLLRDTKKAV
jgi:nucleoside-diphosphate-sugar epimerase